MQFMVLGYELLPARDRLVLETESGFTANQCDIKTKRLYMT